MGQQQREEERREDCKVYPPPPPYVGNQGYEVKQQKIIINALGGMVTGDGHYNVRDCEEQKNRGAEKNAESGAVGHAQYFRDI